MRPLLLTIEGLHSFRERQTVDFAKLCEAGIFGIFGPTGSGKSTILDAMTLALYGKVERAPGHTQGIMNQQSEKLHVSFSFSLANAHGERRFKIERAFKRADETKVKSTTVRLLEEVDNETVVIADRKGEVDEAIADLIGLEHEDFTRAVVLPQGKFAEFLALKGVDRRKMLQRLFQLEKYGDELQKKLKVRVDELTAEQQQLESELRGIGDASLERVTEAKARLVESERQLAAVVAQLERSEQTAQQMEQQWQLAEQIARIEQQLAVLEEGSAERARWQDALQLHQEAEKLLPLVTQRSEAQQAVKAADVALQEALVHYEAATVAVQTAKQQYEAARAVKEREEPVLLGRQQQLADAEQRAALVVQLQSETERVTNELAIQRAADAKHGQEVAAKEAELAKWLEAQAKLKKATLELTEQLARKQQLDEAFLAKQQLDQKRERYDETMKLVAEREQHLRTTDAKLRLVDERFVQWYEQGTTLARSLSTMYDVVQANVRQEQYVRQQVRQFNDERERELNAWTEKHLAAQVAEHLHDGEPCPVCGATEHLARATAPAEAKPDGEGLRHFMRQLETETTQFSEQATRLHQALQRLYELQVEHDEPLGEIELTLVTEETMTQSWQQLVERSRLMHQDVLEAEAKLKRLLEAHQQLVREREQLTIVKQQDEKALADFVATRDEWQQQVTLAEAQWREQFSHFDEATIHHEREQLQRAEQEKLVLEQRLEKSVAAIDGQRELLQRLATERQTVATAIARLEATAEQVAQQCHQEQQLLAQVIKTGDLLTAKREVERQLVTIREAEQASYTRWNDAQQQFTTASSQKSQAEATQREQSARLYKAETEWTEVAKPERLATPEAVHAAFIAPTERANWQQQLQQYEQRKHELNGQVTHLAGQRTMTVTADERSAVLAQVQVERERKNEWSEAVGAARQAVTTLLEQHERFTALTTQLQRVNERLEQHRKLQQVLRGNSFVEFLAEEQLDYISRAASERLRQLTNRRYSLEVDANGMFVICDEANGGLRRAVSTLSGGETFLTSLSLALALSGQIQLKGEYPLQFFFLDEGFGTLDADLLETVISSLEQLHSEQLAVGVISHVQELRARLSRKLIVEKAEAFVHGTKVHLE